MDEAQSTEWPEDLDAFHTEGLAAIRSLAQKYELNPAQLMWGMTTIYAHMLALAVLVYVEDEMPEGLGEAYMHIGQAGFVFTECYMAGRKVTQEPESEPAATPAALAQDLPPRQDGVIGLSEVEQLTNLSRVTIWRMEKDGKFPKRLQLAPHRVGWLYGEVMAWLEALPRGPAN